MALTKITSDVIGTGAVTSDHLASGAVTHSSLSSITTDNVSEGSTNTYFTNARARSSVSVTGGGLSYDSGTGVIQIGSIPNASLTNSSLTVNSNSVSLGSSVTLDTDDIGEGSTNLYFTNARAQGAISGGTGVTVSSGTISIGQDVATSSTPTFGNITTTGYIAGPATFTIDPAAVGDNTGTVVIAGNLQVDGTTTTINSTTLTVDDKLVTLASGSVNAAAADGAGIEVDITGVGNPSLLYDGTNDEWDFNKNVNINGTISSGAITSSGNLHAGDGTNISMDGSANGQIEVDGDGYQGAIALDGSAMHLYHNSSSRDLVLGTNETARLTISGTGGFNFESHPVQGITTLSSGAITVTADAGNEQLVIKRASSTDEQLILGFHSSDYATIQAVEQNVAYRPLALQPSGGNVGIGTANPAGNLHVVGATGSSGRIYVSDADDGTGGGDSLLINKSGASAYIYNRDTGSLNLGTNDDSDMVVINASGYVGINTNNPQSNLHVFNDISIDNSTSGTGRRFRFISENAGGFTFRDQTASASRLSVDADGRFTFLNSEGIVLSAKSSNVYALDGSLSYYSSTNGVYLNGAGVNGWLRLNASGVSNNRTSIDLYGSGAGDRIKFRAGDDDAMEIIDGGYVGIHTGSPQTKLSIVEATNYNAPTLGTGSGSFSILKYDNSAGGDYGLLMGVISSGRVWQQVQRVDGVGTAYDLLLQPSGGNVGIRHDAPPSTLSITGTNGAVVASNGAGVNGIQVTRTTNSSENIYFYCTDGNTQGWGGIGNVGRIESYGNNILEIGTQQSAPVSFGSNDTEVFRLRSDGTGLEFPDNNTFISTANTAGGTAYEWGSIRRPASSDGGQLSIRQYSSGDTAANYPAYAGGRGGWDENTGMYFPDTDQVGLSAGGNSGLVCYPSTSAIGVAIQDCLSTRANTTSIRAREHFYHFLSQSTFAYAHMKTDIPWASTTQMYSIKFRGHEYGAAEPIDVSLVWYNYNPSNSAVNIGSAGTHTATVYGSSDGYTVMRITFTSGYYTAFSVSQYPTAQGCALFNITAAAANSTATHY